MPRQTRYCSIDGKQFPLFKNKTQAFEKFYELMGEGDKLKSGKSALV